MTRIAAILIAAMLAGCLEEPALLPTCASLGCPIAPSGSPEAWEPCEDDVCWCGAPAEVCER